MPTELQISPPQKPTPTGRIPPTSIPLPTPSTQRGPTSITHSGRVPHMDFLSHTGPKIHKTNRKSEILNRLVSGLAPARKSTETLTLDRNVQRNETQPHPLHHCGADALVGQDLARLCTVGERLTPARRSRGPPPEDRHPSARPPREVLPGETARAVMPARSPAPVPHGHRVLRLGRASTQKPPAAGRSHASSPASSGRRKSSCGTSSYAVARSAPTP